MRLLRGLAIVSSALALPARSVTAQVTVTEKARLHSAWPAANEAFGELVALEADTALVVTSGSLAAPNPQPAAYVFRRSNGAWSLEQRFLVGYPGYSPISLDLDIASGQDLLAIGFAEPAYDSRFVEVYHRTTSGWTFEQSFSPAGSYEDFADSVSVDAGRLAIVNTQSGAKVWRRTGPAQWALEWTGSASLGSLALRGDLLVGGPTHWFGGGVVRVFQRTGTSWNQIAFALPLPAGPYPIAIDEEGNIAVGNPSDDDAGTDAGAVYVLRRSGPTSWVQHAKILSPEYPMSQYFGQWVAIDAGTLVVPSLRDDGAAIDAGAVYVFRRNDGWVQAAKVMASDAAAGDLLGGITVACDDGTLLAGASGDDDLGSNAGSAYVFHLEAAAEIYCTAKLNSQNCLPAVAYSGSPSFTSTSPFTIRCLHVLNGRNGLFFYGLSGRAATPFQGGLQCAHAPVRRTGVQSSGGNPPPDDCSGSYAIDFNAWAQSGVDPNLSTGTQVDGQFWCRDPLVPSGTGLSDAIEFVLAP